MRKKLKLLVSLSTFCLAIAVLCFGVFAAIKVTYTISGSISYDVNDAYVKINTTVYASTKVLTQEQVEQYTLDFVTTDPTTVEGITLVKDDVEEYSSTSATTEPATGEVETGNLTGGSTYFFKVNIQNLSTNEVSASAKAESEMTIPTNMYQFNSGAVTEITTEGKNIVIALSVENPAQALDEEAYNIGINVNAGDEQTLSQLSLTPITETTEATYNVQNSTAPVSGYSVSATDTDIQGLDGVLNIPTYVDGLPILQVAERAFANCTNLTHILIPTTVQEMGAECFAGCAGLTELTIPFVGRVNYETQEQASEDADISTFYHFFDTVEFDGSVACMTGYESYTCYLPNILTINVLNGCKIMPDDAFYDDDCMAITIQTVNLPSSLTYLGVAAFQGCVYLETVSIPENTNIDTLKELVFMDCESLINFVIPSSVTNIGGQAFDGTPWLENLEANTNGLKIVEASNNPSVKFLMGVDNENLPADGIITAEMLAGVRVIYESAFEDCDNLTVITIPNSVTRIGHSGFSGCTNLQEITISDTVESIGVGAFYGCQLTNVICNIQGTDYSLVNGKLTIKNMRHEEDTGHTERYNDNVNPLVTSVEFPANCTEIVDYAFSGCSSLKEITIPDTVESIGPFAFNSCESLASVTFAENSRLESIGVYAFDACGSLTEITIPSSVAIIKECAFEDCSSLSELTFMHTTGTIEIEIFAFSRIKSGATATFASSLTKWTSSGTTYTGSAKLTDLHATKNGEVKTWTITKNS